MIIPRFSRSRVEGGQALSEFALVILLIAIVLIVLVTLFGRTVHTTYCRITHQVAPEADISSTCTIPIVMPQISSPNPNQIVVEAEVYDPDGDPANPYAQITRVEFYIDSTQNSPVTVELLHRYCLGTGDSTCGSYNIGSLPPGDHSVIILAYDSDGNVGRATLRFRK